VYALAVRPGSARKLRNEPPLPYGRRAAFSAGTEASTITENGMSRCPTGPASGPGAAIAPPQWRISTVEASPSSCAPASTRSTGSGSDGKRSR
jgi:hypothetical protein